MHPLIGKSLRWACWIVGSILLLFLALSILALNDAFGPPLSIERKGSVRIVHVETLGEYPTTIRHVRIEEAGTGKVVFDARIRPEHRGRSEEQIHNFRLQAGENPIDAVNPDEDVYAIVEPKGRASFSLSPGTDYRLTVWETPWIPSREKLRF
ncbi:MAG: hypothetical protein WCE75_17050 [Terracidiphilus sp.]